MIEVVESTLQKAAGEGMDEFIQAFTDKYKEIIGGEFLDVFQPRLGRAFRHVDDGFLAQLLGGPGDAAAVVAIGCREEGCLAEFLAELI